MQHSVSLQCFHLFSSIFKVLEEPTEKWRNLDDNNVLVSIKRLRTTAFSNSNNVIVNV